MKYYKIIYKNDSLGDLGNLVIGVLRSEELAKEIIKSHPSMQYEIEVIEGDIYLLSDL